MFNYKLTICLRVRPYCHRQCTHHPQNSPLSTDVGGKIILLMVVTTKKIKAYRRVEWSFTRDVVNRMGFDLTSIIWVTVWVEFVLYPFLINGSPLGSVKSFHGIRGSFILIFIYLVYWDFIIYVWDGAKGCLSKASWIFDISHMSTTCFLLTILCFCKSSAYSVTALKEILSSYDFIGSMYQIS